MISIICVIVIIMFIIVIITECKRVMRLSKRCLRRTHLSSPKPEHPTDADLHFYQTKDPFIYPIHSVQMYNYISLSLYIYIYTYIYIYICICVYIYGHVHIHIYIYIYTQYVY